MADVQRAQPGLMSSDRNDIFVAIGVILVVMMLIIPLPSVLLDALMAINLMLSLLIILIVLYTKHALEFSVFPTLLLVTTVFGLALNVSSTRLILGQGIEFDGKMVKAFGSFVVGSSGSEGLVIGIIIFLIIVGVQFMVITKGATRVAEVAARFTLDALPGKQMAIEAEYNSGLLTEDEARTKKKDLQREVDFYGAMDGASKFVSGNVKIGILITLINIIGGLIVGVIFKGEPIMTAAGVYVQFTIGDGLISQFPALLISVATGLIVTRSISENSFGNDVTKEFSQQGKIYYIASAFLGVLALLPGFPWYVLIPMAIITFYLGYSFSRRDRAKRLQDVEKEKQAEQTARTPADVSPIVPLDPLSLELGYGLIPLVDRDQGAELLERVTRIRREAALDLGLVVPKIRIIDNMRLEPSEYCLKIKGVEVGRGSIRIGHYMAINPGSVSETVPGESAIDPAFGLPALWITEENREDAERAGYTVVDAPSIVATHLTEIIKRHASDILGRQEVQSILETLKKDYPAVTDEIHKSLGIGEIQKVLQGLLNEQVSIRNMVIILETLADYSAVTKDIGFLIEKTRQALSRQICLQYSNDDRIIHVITLDPALEQKIIDSRMDTAGGAIAAMEPAVQRKWIGALSATVRDVQSKGFYPLILTSEAARQLVKASTVREIPDLVVLSVPEIVSDMRVEAVGEIRLEG